MSTQIADSVLGQDRPRGLKRLILLLLAHTATEGGQLPFGEADQERYALQAVMRGDRFSRIVEELRHEGFVSVDGTVLTLYAGEPTEGGQVPQTSLLPQAPVAGGSVKGGEPPSQNAGNAVQAVLSFYCSLFGPRKWGEDDKREVRAALQIATVKELEEAIQGNKLSDYHQGVNERQKKYNTLGHIIRGKQGKRTRRENIDMFREIFDKAQTASGGVKAAASGADPAIIKTRKEEVRRAHRLAHDQEAQERGRRAEEWLLEQGIPTHRKPDDYPIWPGGGS